MGVKQRGESRLNKATLKKNRILISIREENNLTQRELARKSGCSERSVQNYEAGRRVPDVHTAQRIARKLNTTVEALFPLPEEQELRQKPDCSRTRKVS